MQNKLYSQESLLLLCLKQSNPFGFGAHDGHGANILARFTFSRRIDICAPTSRPLKYYSIGFGLRHIRDSSKAGVQIDGLVIRSIVCVVAFSLVVGHHYASAAGSFD